MSTRDQIVTWWTELLSDRNKDARSRMMKVFLIPLSWVYYVAVSMRNLAYDLLPGIQERVSAEVISIGNITTGGTGKTPAVVWFAKQELDRGKKVAVLSRGYGGKRSRGQVIVVSNGDKLQTESTLAGEEPILLAKKLPGVPVLVCTQRATAARMAIERFGSQVLILDDGFQHRQLARDRDIVLVDTTRPLAAERLLPRGRLREPLKGLGRATQIMLTRCDQGEALEEQERFVRRFNDHAPVVRSVHRSGDLHDVANNEMRPLEFLKGRAVLAISSIGNPDAFERSLQTAGARIVFSRRLPDHYSHTSQDIKEFIDLLHSRAAESIVCSEKDGVKLGAGNFPSGVCWSLDVEFQTEN